MMMNKYLNIFDQMLCFAKINVNLPANTCFFPIGLIVNLIAEFWVKSSVGIGI